MASELSTEQWSEILLREDLTKEINLLIFQTLYLFDDHKAPASQLGLRLGNQGKSPQAPLNSEIGRFAKRISKHYDIQFTERSAKKYKFYDLFFNGWKEGKLFVWQLKPEIVRALEDCKLTGELPSKPPTAVDIDVPDRRERMISRIIRDTTLAKQIKHIHNHECQLCGHTILLADGSRYAEAHHIQPLGEPHNGPDIPENLVCVCPNHHAELDFGAKSLESANLHQVLGHTVDKSYIDYHNAHLRRTS